MSVNLKQVLGLVVGLIVGVVGGILFSKSLRPEPGSMQDQLEIAQEKLRRAERGLRSMEKHFHRQQSMRDGGLRDLARDFRDGKDISPDDLLATMKPWMRQMSPIFGRIRQINEEDWADAKASEWGRKYDLSDSEKAQLKAWFAEQGRIRQERLDEVIASDETGFVDLMRATEYSWKDAEGAESLMEGFLEGEERESFLAERLDERVRSVQQEADRNLQRLDNLVTLDDDQHEQLFGVLVRGSEDYRPEVKPEGFVGQETALDRAGRDTAIREVLRPEQIQQLDQERDRRREEAEKELRRAGMVLPKDWDLLEGDFF